METLKSRTWEAPAPIPAIGITPRRPERRSGWSTTLMAMAHDRSRFCSPKPIGVRRSIRPSRASSCNCLLILNSRACRPAADFAATLDSSISLAQGAGFVGETVEFFDAADYPDGTWQSVSRTVEVPVDGLFGDLRFSTFFGPFTAGEIRIDNVVLTRPPVPAVGDFDGNGIYDCVDIDSLVAQIQSGANLSQFDLTGDGLVDQADVTAWLRWRVPSTTRPANPTSTVMPISTGRSMDRTSTCGTAISSRQVRPGAKETSPGRRARSTVVISVSGTPTNSWRPMAGPWCQNRTWLGCS